VRSPPVSLATPGPLDEGFPLTSRVNSVVFAIATAAAAGGAVIAVGGFTSERRLPPPAPITRPAPRPAVVAVVVPVAAVAAVASSRRRSRTVVHHRTSAAPSPGRVRPGRRIRPSGSARSAGGRLVILPTADLAIRITNPASASAGG